MAFCWWTDSGPRLDQLHAGRSLNHTLQINQGDTRTQIKRQDINTHTNVISEWTQSITSQSPDENDVNKELEHKKAKKKKKKSTTNIEMQLYNYIL